LKCFDSDKKIAHSSYTNLSYKLTTHTFNYGFLHLLSAAAGELCQEQRPQAGCQSLYSASVQQHRVAAYQAAHD